MYNIVPTGQTCPTVQRTNEENCVDECTSNDDCQYNGICCSNGCGGRTCSDSVEMCQVRSVSFIVLLAPLISMVCMCFKTHLTISSLAIPKNPTEIHW